MAARDNKIVLIAAWGTAAHFHTEMANTRRPWNWNGRGGGP